MQLNAVKYIEKDGTARETTNFINNVLLTSQSLTGKQWISSNEHHKVDLKPA